MAFRLMRYAIAAMQRHLDKRIRSCRWLSRCCFIMAAFRPGRTDVLAGRLCRSGRCAADLW
jgi:hypothetical protein